MSDREWLFRLVDIVERIDRLEGYIENMTYSDFESNSLMIDAVERNLEIIGEAARHIPVDVQKRYAQIPWRDIIGMRHKIAHDYDDLTLPLLWNVVQDELVQLRPKILDIKKDLEKEK